MDDGVTVYISGIEIKIPRTMTFVLFIQKVCHRFTLRPEQFFLSFDDIVLNSYLFEEELMHRYHQKYFIIELVHTNIY